MKKFKKKEKDGELATAMRGMQSDDKPRKGVKRQAKHETRVELRLIF